MNREELHTLIAQTVRPNNKKQINAESLANLFSEMVDATPEGGGGLKYSEERTLYGVEKEVLTDEQKAYNAETYSKMWGGEAVTINVDGIFLTPRFFTIEDEYVRFEVSFDLEGFKVQVIIKLRSDGSVEVSETFSTGDSLVIEYGNAESAKAVFNDPMFFYKRIVLFYFLTFVDLHIKSVPITTDGKTDCVLGYQLEGTEYLLTYDVDTGEIIAEEALSNTLRVYVGVTDKDSVRATYNRDAVSGQTAYGNLVVGENNSQSITYSPLYSKKIANEYIEVAIYRNGVLQTWRINADGTSTLTA